MKPPSTSFSRTLLTKSQKIERRLVANGIDMHDGVDLDVGQSCFAEKTVGTAADTKIDLFRTRIGLVSGAQTRIFRRGRLCDIGHGVSCFEARDPASGLNKRDHLADDQFRPRHVHQDKAHMGAVEGFAGQSGLVSVTLANLDLLQSEVTREMSRRVDEASAAVDPENRTGWTGTLAQKMQNAARAASDIDDPLSGLDPDSFELGVGIRR